MKIKACAQLKLESLYDVLSDCVREKKCLLLLTLAIFKNGCQKEARIRLIKNVEILCTYFHTSVDQSLFQTPVGKF